MLPSRLVIFTTIDGTLQPPSGTAWQSASDALSAAARHGLALVLSTSGTRAQIEPLRRKIERGHPFLTETGAGLFIPDGYFNIHLEGATRVGRNFCVPFARSHAEAVLALAEIAGQAGANVAAFSQMSAREIARNSGLSPRDAELFSQREFGEIFFFAGETAKTTQRFVRAAGERGWEAVPGDPLWELRGPLHRHGGNATKYLMSIYRKAVHGRLRSAGIGNDARDLHLLSAVDRALLLPNRQGEFDRLLLSRLPRACRVQPGGAAGWAAAVMQALDKS